MYAQWSAAAACNNEKAAGELVTCNLGQCSLFDSHNATVAASFMYVPTTLYGYIPDST